MHPFWSDGKGFPGIIAKWFKDRGYHFIAFTEHDRLQEGPCWISTDPRTDPGRTIARDGLLRGVRAVMVWLNSPNPPAFPQVLG